MGPPWQQSPVHAQEFGDVRPGCKGVLPGSAAENGAKAGICLRRRQRRGVYNRAGGRLGVGRCLWPCQGPQGLCRGVSPCGSAGRPAAIRGDILMAAASLPGSFAT
ncbi:hypothetical protein MASR2M74_20960 [Paracoccaceae bacterium]